MTSEEAYDWLRQHSLETAHLRSLGRCWVGTSAPRFPPRAMRTATPNSPCWPNGYTKRLPTRVGERLAGVEGSELVREPLWVEAVNVRECAGTMTGPPRFPRTWPWPWPRPRPKARPPGSAPGPRATGRPSGPFWQRLVDLKRQEAEALGYADEPYDALLDDYEPGETAAGLAPMLAELRDALIGLLEAIQGSSRRPDRDLLHRHFPRADQERFARLAAEKIGYDLQGGRLDPTAHPFSTGIGPGDARITTRYDENCFSTAFFSVLHETGHALYDQGLPAEHWGTPRGQAVSLGIHESQSRMWENLVGRSRGFWQFFYPEAQKTFPALDGVDLKAFHRAVNEVRPNLIRTEADEVTYNLHILLRFELERALVRGDLQVADLPGAWNEKMEAFLGLTPPNYSQGVMQDVHWSAGHLGYFPTYTLGNLYAAQFFARAAKDLGDLEASFARGDFGPLLNWLREKIHSQGNRYRSRGVWLRK